MFFYQISHAQVSGTVYLEYPVNGTTANTYGVKDANELGRAGVIVTAYSAAGVILASYTTTSAATQNYSIPASGPAYNGVLGSNTGFVPSGTPVRLEFTGLPGDVASSFNGTTNNTSVQFVTAPNNTASFGINKPDDYCEANPTIATSVYFNGNPLVSGTTSMANAILTFDNNSAGNGTATGTDPATSVAITGQIGSTFSIAWDRGRKKMLVGAFAKRHVGFGPLGEGGIYEIDYSTGSPVVGNWLDIKTLGIPVTNVGTGATIADRNISRGLTGNITDKSVDAAGFTAVGKTSIGNIELSKNADTLFLVNLTNQTVYAIDVATKTLIGTYPPPAAGCVGTFRNFALKYYEGKLYMGGVCDGTTPANMNSKIYRLDGSTWTEIFSMPMDYTKGYAFWASCATFTGWYPWTDTPPAACDIQGAERGFAYPTPILSDIEFDLDGSMILAFMDRTSHQIGWRNASPTDINDTWSSFVGGDILRVYNNNGTYVLENNGVAGPNTSLGANNGQGPGGGEFYNNDFLFGPHAETSMGGLAFLKGSDEIILTAMDPFETAYETGGINWFNNTNGQSRPMGYYVYAGPQSFGKSAGLGDVEILCGLAPLEIGNRVWNDVNNNGVQDAGEPGIGNVSIELYAANGTTLLATTTTDANGNWFFRSTGTAGQFWVNNAGTNSAIQANTAYVIVVGPSDWTGGAGTGELTGYLLTAANAGGPGQPDVRDNDAILSPSLLPAINYTTSGAGRNDHTLDMGFYFCPTLSQPSADQNICEGEIGGDITVRTTSNAVGSIRFVRFTTDQMTGTTPTPAEAANIYAGAEIATVTPVGAGSPYTATYGWNSADFAAPGTYYIYAIANPDLGAPCRPVQEIVVTVNPAPTATFTQTPPTCTGATANNNGIITFATATNVTNFGISTAGAATYDGPAYPAATFVAVGQNVSTTIPNTGGTYIIRVFNGDASCFTDVTVTVTAVSCAITCIPPVISVVPGTVCAGNLFNLNSLVTGNSPAGTLSFYATLADADAGTNPMLNTIVTPLVNASYYVRSTIDATCYSVGTLSVMVSTPPLLSVVNGQVCAGGSINLATLVTNTGGGTLSYFTTLANAQNNINALASPVVAPVLATNYFIRSTNAAGCYAIQNVVVSLAAANCGAIQVSGPN